MAGITNSWIEQYTIEPTPCINNTGANIISNCIVWLAIGLILGSITFEKKGSHDASQS